MDSSSPPFLVRKRSVAFVCDSKTFPCDYREYYSLSLTILRTLQVNPYENLGCRSFERAAVPPIQRRK
jgi:hypothetical protein